MTVRTRLAVLLAATVVVLAGCGDDPTAEEPQPASGSTTSQEPTAGSEASDPSDPSADTESEADTDADTVTVPVYFTGTTPQGTRLYREFRRVDAADPLGGALTLAASGDSLDPDYGTLVPGGSFETDGSATISLPDDSWTRLPGDLSEAEGLLALQQLVYTAQGVLQSRDPITFTDSDGAATQVFGYASEDGFTAGDPLRTLALVSVTSPEQGAKVRDVFTASGVSSSFEATTPWQIRNADGKVVEKGFSTAEGWMDKLYPWETEVDVSGLAPGEYTFVAMTDDPSSGEGGGPTEDSKVIIVG
ncbi:MAG: Gmad2 immunoglobulin-like domain-containing protein [Nocardioides sp.]